jgi:hypothetical protein
MDNPRSRPMVPRHRHSELSDLWVPERRPPVATKGDAVSAVAESAVSGTSPVTRCPSRRAMHVGSRTMLWFRDADRWMPLRWLPPEPPRNELSGGAHRRTAYKSVWQSSGKRRFATLGHATGEHKTRPELWFGVEPPAGIEPATHPYHGSCTHRCANQRFPRSWRTVDRQVMCSWLVRRPARPRPRPGRPPRRPAGPPGAGCRHC